MINVIQKHKTATQLSGCFILVLKSIQVGYPAQDQMQAPPEQQRTQKELTSRAACDTFEGHRLGRRLRGQIGQRNNNQYFVATEHHHAAAPAGRGEVVSAGVHWGAPPVYYSDPVNATK